MKKKIFILSMIVILCVSGLLIFGGVNATSYGITQDEADEAYDFLYGDLTSLSKQTTYYDFLDASEIKYLNYSFDGSSDYLKQSETFDYEGNYVYLLSYKEKIDYRVDISDAGYYEIYVDYYVVGDPLTNFQVNVKINNENQYSESENIDVPLYWEDATKEFSVDSYGDETVPQNVRIEEWNTLSMYDSEYISSTPLLFYFEEGTQFISFELLSSTGQLALGDLVVKSPEYISEYSQYISDYSSDLTSQELYELNAIDYVSKNSSYIRLENLNDELAVPFSVKSDLLNIIDGTSWYQSGQSVSYDVEVEADGFYNIALHYRNSKNEYDVFRSIYIDGEVLFSELLNYQFSTTGSEYANETLGNYDGAYDFYLTEGTHTITLKADSEPLYEVNTKLQLIIDHINQLSLEVLKITGSDIDEDRTWDITTYIPNVEDYLDAYDTLLKNCIDEASQYSDKGSSSATIAYLARALKLLDKVREKPEELPLYLDTLYSGTSSINQLLGDTLDTLADQPLTLERIYVSSNDAELPKANSNFFINLKNSVVQLWDTFFSDKYKQDLDDDVINVWVSYPMTYITILQNMIDADFNQYSETKIKLSTMPDSSKLTLAVAAGNAPDIVLGIPSYMPFDLGIRNAVYDLTEFDDFYDVADRFAPGTLLSFLISDDDGDAFYAIPETLNFNALVYREDIFSALNITTDLNTWDDIIGILPSLQRYGMNFYMPISADNSTKWFYQTAPLILQAGGTIYSDDGLSVDLNSAEAIAGLDTLTRLFTDRALPESVPLFYSEFRSGTLPIGIIDFSTYLQLKNAAPEIAGKWEMTLPVGTSRTDSNGDTYVDRTYISSGTADAIMADAKDPDICWEFLKWWTSTEVQTEFGYTLQSTYGPEYLWLSSNVDAIVESQLDTEDKAIILESLDWIVDSVKNPGQYMVERSLSNIWTATVLDGDPLRVEIENNVITMNREITLKMTEFGYIDSSGNIIKKFYTRDLAWIINKIEEGKSS